MRTIKDKHFYLASAKNKVVIELDKALKLGATTDDITKLVNLISGRYLSRQVDPTHQTNEA